LDVGIIQEADTVVSQRIHGDEKHIEILGLPGGGETEENTYKTSRYISANVQGFIL
jgi:hypothetical protein